MQLKKIYLIFFLSIALDAKEIKKDLSLDNPDAQGNRVNKVNSCSKRFNEVFDLVNSKAYFPVYYNESLNKALDAFVHCDEYSHFLGPEDYKKLLKSTQGQFYGIGAAIAPKKIDDDFLLILRVLPNSPAEKAKLQKYDKIIAIDNKPVQNLSMEEALNKIKGEKRFSQVNLDIIRDKKELLSVTLKRDIIEDNNIHSYYIANKEIYYLAISNFTHNLDKKIRELVKKANSYPLKGIILDLRDNAGGVLETAVNCASIFLKKDSLIVITKNRHNQVIDHKSTKQNPEISKPIPIIILVNEFTASAAEILSGALQDNSEKPDSVNPHIFMLGTETYGKASVQEVIPLDNNCALKITTCLYYLPNGRSIDKCGIKPDFIIQQKFPAPKELEILTKLAGKTKNQNNKLDKALGQEDKVNADNALDSTLDNIWRDREKNRLKEDYQLKCAISLIETLNLGKKINNLANKTKAKEFLNKHSCWCSNLDLKEL